MGISSLLHIILIKPHPPP